MFGLGELPKEYNPKVHGPYDPATYYGPSKYYNLPYLLSQVAIASYGVNNLGH